jgi:hypothetical protein
MSALMRHNFWLGPYFAVGSADSIGPDLYVSHSDGRVYNSAIDTTSGTVTKLKAPDHQTGVDIVKGLPRSKADHAPNLTVWRSAPTGCSIWPSAA